MMKLSPPPPTSSNESFPTHCFNGGTINKHVDRAAVQCMFDGGQGGQTDGETSMM